jgi:hypothetical protein
MDINLTVTPKEGDETVGEMPAGKQKTVEARRRNVSELDIWLERSRRWAN